MPPVLVRQDCVYPTREAALADGWPDAEWGWWAPPSGGQVAARWGWIALGPEEAPTVKYLAVWGFGSTGSEVGILDEYATREEAQDRVRRFLASETNPAVGAWVRRPDEDD